MKDQQTPPNTTNFSCRIVTWITAFCLLVQGAIPAYGVTLSNAQIESDLASNHAFVLDTNNRNYQYIASPYIDASAPLGAMEFESFLDSVIAEYDHALGGPKYVPIGVGDITTFIPTYPQYKAVGDALVQSRYVRAQIRGILGRTLIDSTKSKYSTESAQLNTLFQNTLNYIQSNPSVRVGDLLGLDQDGANGALAYPIIWPELRSVHGENVLVPIVYLTSTEMARKVTGNTTFFGDGATFNSLVIDGTTIQLGKDAFLNVVNSLVNNGGELLGTGDLTIRVGGELKNLSGLIQAQGNLSIAAKSIESRTIVHRYDTDNGHDSYFGEISSISSVDGSVVLRAYEDIIIAGSVITAGQDIKFAADGSIYIGTVQISSSYNNDGVGGWRASQGSSIEYLGSVLSAGESIELIANGEIVIDASEIVADNGHIEILAGLGITVIDELNATQSYQQGQFGSTSKEVSAYKTVAIRSLLDAGKGINLHTGFGDITLKAVDISSTEGTSVTASNGAINLLVTKETDHYSYSSVRESLFTVKTISRGHDIETVVPNTIVGGLQVDALSGINVEYEGDPDLSLEAQLQNMAQMPGLEWMADVRSQHGDSAHWDAMEAKYEEWNDSSTSLSPAAIAVIAIAITIATSGAASGWGDAIANSLGFVETVTVPATASFTAATGVSTAASYTAVSATAANAFAAGLSSLFVTAGTTLANGVVNDDIGEAFDQLASTETLTSVATAILTSAAIQTIDAEFFNVSDVDGASILWDEIVDAQGGFEGFALSFEGQALQAVTHATVNAGLQNLAYGADFTDSFYDALVQDGVNQLGEYMAGAIGENYASSEGTPLDTAIKYISHAGVGCILGAALPNEDTESSCYAGAGGAVIGELVGGLYRDSDEMRAAQEELEAFLAENAGEVLGMNAEQLHSLLSSDAYYTTLYHRVNDLREKGIDISRLSAALGAFVAGGDAENIYTAAFTGENSAANNALNLASAFAILQEYIARIEASIRNPVGAAEEVLSELAPQVGDWLIEQGVGLQSTIDEGAENDDLLARLVVSLQSTPGSSLYGKEAHIVAGFLAGVIDMSAPAGIPADLFVKILASNTWSALDDIGFDLYSDDVVALDPYTESGLERIDIAIDEVKALVANIDQIYVQYEALSNLASEGDYTAQAELARLSVQLAGGVSLGAYGVVSVARQVPRVLDVLSGYGRTIDDINDALPNNIRVNNDVDSRVDADFENIEVTQSDSNAQNYTPRSQGLLTPQGLTPSQFDELSSAVRSKADELELGDDVFIQGSRAGGTASPESDIDIAIRVSPERFDEIINDPELSTLSAPNSGSALERTRIISIEYGRIQTGEARLSSLRDLLEQQYGFEVQISIVREGGAFDNGPQTNLSFDFQSEL